MGQFRRLSSCVIVYDKVSSNKVDNFFSASYSYGQRPRLKRVEEKVDLNHDSTYSKPIVAADLDTRTFASSTRIVTLSRI